MKLIILFHVLLTVFSLFPQLTISATISSNVKYENKQWTGNVACQFINQVDCELSMHVQGRRIDLDNQKSNEIFFVSCFSPNTAVGLTLTNFTYENIQDYTCFQDKTQEYAHTWLYPVPSIEVKGNESVGEVVEIYCNSVPGASLYWIFPGKPDDNAGINVTEYTNKENSTTVATFQVNDKINNPEYKCCIKAKYGQDTQLPCVSHKIYINDVQLISTSADFTNSASLTMSCAYQSKLDANPDPNKVDWQQCPSITNVSCAAMSSNYYTRVVNDATHTLNTTLKINYDSLYSRIYLRCRYNGSTSNIFKVVVGTYTPRVKLIDKRAYYSNNGSSVALKCNIVANSTPSITWIKTNVLNFANGSEVINSGGAYSVQTIPKSNTEWESTLVIFPYDDREHTSNYSCVANNFLGVSLAQTTTSQGPTNMNLQLISYPSENIGKYTVKGVCTFKTFPFLFSSYFNVATAENLRLRTSTKYNNELMQVVATLDFDISDNAPPPTIQCNAFDRFNNNTRLSKTTKVTYFNTV